MRKLLADVRAFCLPPWEVIIEHPLNLIFRGVAKLDLQIDAA